MKPLQQFYFNTRFRVRLFFSFATRIFSAFRMSDELIFSRSRYILLVFSLILRDIHAIIRPKLRFME